MSNIHRRITLCKQEFTLKRKLLCVFLGVFVCVASPQYVIGLACEESGYCSFGTVSPFFGAIHTAKGLLAALEARSYKKEVILQVSSHERMSSSLMSFRSLEQLGIEHYMLLMGTRDSCSHSISRLPRIGCTWYNTSLTNHDSGRTVLVVLRYHVAARAVRLGYNVFVIDSDSIFIRDPYVFLKQFPFSDFQAINQEEVLDGWYSNTGVTYLQNIAPDGPMAWILGSLADRWLRITEDDGQFRMSMGFNAGGGDDQDMYNDLLRNALVGRVCPMLAHVPEIDAERRRVVEDLMIHRIDGQIHVQTLEFDVPKEWEPVVGGASTSMRFHSLKMPHSKDGLPSKELKLWPFYPERRGARSQEFYDIFMADCPQCRIWPDPLDPAQADRAMSIPEEQIAWFPHWMAVGWYHRGRLGYWDNRTTTPPQAVIAHVHSGQHECGDGDLSKVMIVCFLGYCDFDFRHQYFPRHLYYSSTPQRMTPPVLALSPDVDLSTLRNSVEAWWIFHGLAQVAYALGRAVVWPDIPCKAPYIPKTPGGDKTVPLDLNLGFLPHGPLATLQCSWDMWWLLGCMADGRGMYTTEFEHLLSKLPQEQRGPMANTTILAPAKELLPAIKKQAKAKASKMGGWLRWKAAASAADITVQVDVKELREAASHLSSAPVLYLAHPVRVNFGAEQTAFDEHWSKCPPMDRAKAEATCKTMAYGNGDAARHEEVLAASVGVQDGSGQRLVLLQAQAEDD